MNQQVFRFYEKWNISNFIQLNVWTIESWNMQTGSISINQVAQNVHYSHLIYSCIDLIKWFWLLMQPMNKKLYQLEPLDVVELLNIKYSSASCLCEYV